MPDKDLPLHIASVTIEATVTRADGTVEDLGVVASTDDDSITLAPNDKD